jgi:bifunctional non-homologous end joining protein LigD
LLKELFDRCELEVPVRYSEHLIGDGQEMFAHAAKLNWEGIISKKADAPYRSERTEGWLTAQRGKFPVIGFVKDPTGIAALYLGKSEGGELVYMGKVGTGWSRTVSSQIRKQLNTVVSPKSKLQTHQSPSRSPRRPGSSLRSWPTWSTAISRPRAARAELVQGAYEKELSQ